MNSIPPIEKALFEKIELEARRTGKTIQEIVNEAIRVGLREMREPGKPAPYQTKTVSMGHPSQINLDKATKIATELETIEMVQKMAPQK